MSHYFITGASAGIGAALAEALTNGGHHVSAVVRRKERLDERQSKTDLFNGYTADVRDVETIAAAVNASQLKFGPVDVAILNAGIYTPQDGKQIVPSVYAEHMDINYMGVVNTLASVIPQMVASGRGHVVIISSVAGWRGLPKAAAYGPTKAALISHAESQNFDLTPKNKKIQVK